MAGGVDVLAVDILHSVSPVHPENESAARAIGRERGGVLIGGVHAHRDSVPLPLSAGGAGECDDERKRDRWEKPETRLHGVTPAIRFREERGLLTTLPLGRSLPLLVKGPPRVHRRKRRIRREGAHPAPIAPHRGSSYNRWRLHRNGRFLSKSRDSMEIQHRVTELLLSWSDGDRDALNQLMPLVYGELRTIARHRLRSERAGHTLDTTGLVHEAYLKLVQLDRVRWNSRAHFLAIAAHAMRNILVSHARSRKRLKRGGGAPHASLDEAMDLPGAEADRILSLDESLERLAALNPRHA